ncbi:DNA cytosine methyltransferase [Stutzerimonas stutzeri]|uniref:DNA cytosine methyltransferase n=1 Tax=Stutzerimonas stutzeri TaxID=316 RepID=UPI000374F444|nr:DNA cytosine methyltransferase [Stutzerimonas stutzeri]
MNELALFAGAGGGILGGHLLGWRTVCAVERDAYAAQVLAQRQNDGCLPAFPIWSDVCSFDGRPWRGLVDVVSGGFPCQDISAAGNGAGIDGERSGLWRQMARIVGEVRPRFVFVENSPLLVGRGLAVVLGDLAELGYDAQWFRLSASDCGAPHQRDRLWLAANAPGEHGAAWGCLDSSAGRRASAQPGRLPRHAVVAGGQSSGAWPESEPGIHRMDDGLPDRVDRLKALGNAQVPRVAAAAFSMLAEQGGRVNG